MVSTFYCKDFVQKLPPTSLPYQRNFLNDMNKHYDNNSASWVAFETLYNHAIDFGISEYVTYTAIKHI